MEKEKILREKLEKLRKCKGLSKEDLEGRYKNSYQRLKVEIKDCATEILREIALGNLMWSSIDYMAAANEVNDFLKQTEGRAIMKNISHVLYTNCSYEEFYAECLKMREQVTKIFFKYSLLKREKMQAEE